MRSVFLSALLLVLPAPLLADTTYTYTGNTYCVTGGPVVPCDGGPIGLVVRLPSLQADSAGSGPTLFSISGSFTVSSPLGADLTDQSIDPESFQFSNGGEIFSNSTVSPSGETLAVWTDASGKLTNWLIELDLSNGDFLNTVNEPNLVFDSTFIAPSFGGNDNDPGTWSVSSTDPISSPVPEPSSLALIGTGVIGAFCTLRRRLLN